jgi:hypothetical protein
MGQGLHDKWIMMKDYRGCINEFTNHVSTTFCASFIGCGLIYAPFTSMPHYGGSTLPGIFYF